ncbi:MAG: serine/threonine protein kinase [Nonomuraea sp.]|nr:serine/threonine protein kinase [Nonomuraea sp.]
MMGPLLTGDPVEVGGFRIAGRLGEGGQGVVYLGETPDGRRVAVKLLGAGLGDDAGSRARFGQEIGYARRVKAFCTAQVLASGESDGVPYVVSEYVDGPSLAQVITERGALRGAELRRLAVGTLTALAAIHRAGVVHRDFKPGNVLLSRDGPRVIDFGISRALEEAEPGGDSLVGTPPYMAPEQFAGRPAGPPADLFAWGSTMVCAATGRPPFGTRELPAVVNRIMYGEPDLGDLDGDLRDLVTRCLAKDPSARPVAARALLTLLGHRGQELPAEGLLAEGRQVADQRPQGAPGPGEARGGRRWVPVAGAVAAALVVLGVVGVVLGVRAGAPGSSGKAAVTPPAPRQGALALTSTVDVKIPDTGITLHENPADPVWVSSYHDKRDGLSSYVRDPATGRFGAFGTWHEPIAPGGGYVASLSTRSIRTDFETIRLRDRVTGWSGEIRTVAKPATLFYPAWSEGGRRLLVTVFEPDGKGNRAVGFTIVDPVKRTARTVKASDGGRGMYVWGSDGGTMLHAMPGGAVRALDLNGRQVRRFDRVGDLAAGGVRRTTFGTVFATTCPGKQGDICLWDESTGARKGVIRLPKGGGFHGWLDDGHFLGTLPGGRTTKLVLMDAQGRVVRALADGPAAELGKVVLWFTRKAA